MKTAIASLILLVSVSRICHAGTLKDEFELKKKCGEEATIYYGLQPIDGNFIKGFSNHYNKKLNTCLILYEKIKTFLKDSSEYHKEKMLIDINDNNTLGSLIIMRKSVMDCNLMGKKCKTEKEFDRLIKPYMTQ